ncbi:MAG: histidinol-phosphate transaminase [Opitutales bacterium]|nr:histidinol-phosphate transaminase [Opitutales bacterium]
MTRSLRNLALPHIPGLHAYTPGSQPSGGDWVKLNTNECPYPPSPKVGEALRNFPYDKLRLYPNPRGEVLRQALADFYELSADRVLLGNGSDDILNLLVRAFCWETHHAVFPEPSYSLYPTLVAIQNGQARTLSFTQDMHLPEELFIGQPQETILFLTNPNAPTGVLFSQHQIIRLLESFPGLVVVDEAYGEFARESAIPLLKEYPKLAVTRTFSKSYALAGCRLGYLLGSPELIGLIDRIRDSYNVNALTQVAGLAALADQSYYQKIRSAIIAERNEFIRWCEEREWCTFPSEANFVFTAPKKEDLEGAEAAASAFAFLEKKKILVRYFPKLPLTAPYLRITVGRPEEMAAVRQALAEWAKT